MNAEKSNQEATHLFKGTALQEKNHMLVALIFENSGENHSSAGQYADTYGVTKNGVEGVLRLWDVDEMGLYLATFHKGLDRKISFEFFEESNVEKVANVVLSRIEKNFKY